MVLSKMNIQTLRARVTRFNPYGFLAATNGRIFNIIYDMDAQLPGSAEYRD